MYNLINALKNRDLKVTNYGQTFGKGTYRVIYKCNAGYMSSNDSQNSSPIDVFRSYKMKYVHSIAYITESGNALTLYARSGKKVWIVEQLLSELTVGDINGNDLTNTALYSQTQYNAVNAKTWASKAYVMNEEKEMVA